MSKHSLNAKAIRERASEVGDSTLDDIARRTGLDESTVWRLLAGRTEPQAGSLVALKTAYDISLDVLLIVGETDEPEPQGIPA